MLKRVWIAAALLAGIGSFSAVSRETAGVSKKYKALKYALAPSEGTWAILDRDGANRQMEPYLSSLGGGESGTGAIASPPFVVSVDKIAFTICGHDGQDGGRNENLIALVDAGTGNVLRKTMAPGEDPMQERAWDVAEFKGRKVRIEVRDGNTAGAYAWLGVGRIDAGPALKIDFRKGLPKTWTASAPPRDARTELVEGGIPFLRRSATYSMIPKSGAIEIACGFRAERLFFLGGTVASGEPLVVYGYIEIVYRGGHLERYPLMFGYTLDGGAKLISPSKALYLHPSGDQFQHYLVVSPGLGVIETIRLERNSAQPWLPRITAITCETPAVGNNLAPLPNATPTAGEAAWIQSHTLTATFPNMNAIAAEILRAHRR